MKRIVFILAMLWPVVTGFCQTRPQLTVGDFVEDLPPSFYTDKPTILYFFATWCQPCIRKMPALDSLVTAQNGKLAIITITHETNKLVNELRAKNKIFAAVRLPIVCGDSLLRRIFPYRTVPHMVWLIKGRVYAITGSDALNASTIDQFIKGQPLHIAIKKEQMDFDRHKPIMENDNGQYQDKVIYSTLFTQFLPGIPSGGGNTVSEDSTTKRIYFLNNSLPDLFAAASGIPRHSKNIRLNMSNPAKYKRPESMPYTEWVEKGTYCFEITIPLNTPDSTWRRVMMETLNLLSPLHAVRKGNHLIISEKN